jgi:hypothetical protein
MANTTSAIPYREYTPVHHANPSDTRENTGKTAMRSRATPDRHPTESRKLATQMATLAR